MFRCAFQKSKAYSLRASKAMVLNGSKQGHPSRVRRSEKRLELKRLGSVSKSAPQRPPIGLVSSSSNAAPSASSNQSVSSSPSSPEYDPFASHVSTSDEPIAAQSHASVRESGLLSVEVRGISHTAVVKVSAVSVAQRIVSFSLLGVESVQISSSAADTVYIQFHEDALIPDVATLTDSLINWLDA